MWRVYQGKCDVYFSMALDEALLKTADKGPILRFYEINPPALILGCYQSLDDAIPVNCKARGIDLTRRLSVGSAMFCDSDVVAYSIIDVWDDKIPDIVAVHKERHGPRIIQAIEKLGVAGLKLGNHFSIRIDGRILAGHGQCWKSFDGRQHYLYQGVIPLRPWPVDKISQVLRLRDQFREGDYLRNLPALSHYANVNRGQVVDSMIQAITGGDYQCLPLDRSVEDEARRLAVKFQNDAGWLSRSDLKPECLERGQGFCFSLFIEEEPV